MRVILFIALVFLSSCSTNGVKNITSITLKTLDEKPYSFSQISNNTATVIYFLAPNCPLSENYTLPIKNISNEYTANNIEFIGVVAGEYFTHDEITEYINEFNIEIPLLLDPKMELTNTLKAKITPEVFVLSPKGDVLYSGKIDNWYITLGRNRKKPTEFYLKDALNSILNHKPIAINKTEAVGCFIE